MKIIRVEVDLARNLFQLHGVDRHGKVVWRRRLRRDRWLKVLQESVEPGCEIAMEACSGAHHWARELQVKGFKVKIIPPQFVKHYVKSNKNDAKDAEAISRGHESGEHGLCGGEESRATRHPGHSPHPR